VVTRFCWNISRSIGAYPSALFEQLFHMEETPEGLATAAQTRDAAAKHKRKLEALLGSAAPVKASEATKSGPSVLHEAAVPPGFDDATAGLDAEKHGAIWC
jgi:hypothetical protein